MSTGKRARTAEQRVTQVAGSLQHMGNQPARRSRDQYVAHQEPGCLGPEAGVSLMKSTSQESKPLHASNLVVVSLSSQYAICRVALYTYTQSWLEELHLLIVGARKDQAVGKNLEDAEQTHMLDDSLCLGAADALVLPLQRLPHPRQCA